MRILFLNGNTDAANAAFDGTLRELGQRWTGAGHAVKQLDLRDMNVKSCTGCWSCWWKTPGLCATKDDTDTVRATYIHADLVVFAAPLVHGFPAAVMKDVLDKLIPLGHPYIAYEGGESIHVGRYSRYPAVACLLAKGAGDDEKDLKVVGDYLKRVAAHFRARFLFSRQAGEPVAEVARELGRL